MKLDIEFTILRLAVLSFVRNGAQAISCGNPFTTPCLGDTDIRYDKSASNALKDQAEIWKNIEGLWKFEFKTYGPDEMPFPPQPIANRERVAYSAFPAFGFQNITFIGSRFYRHRYVFFPPAPAEFCAQPLQEGESNVAYGVCGQNGYAWGLDVYGTSTYEKDGSLKHFGGKENRIVPVDSESYFLNNREGDLLVQDSFVCLGGGCDKGVSTMEVYYGAQLVSFDRFTYTRVDDEDEWLRLIDEAHVKYNITAENQLDVPMKGCVTSNCPLPEDFCQEGDPECSMSPYQEPSASVKGGVIAGFTVLGVALLCIGAYLVHRREMELQSMRIRDRFATRICQNMSLKQSIRQLPPDALAEEFKRIDGEGTLDGKISRQELWDFISSGKAGEMSESDFNALFVAMDADGNGEVDFLEFCSFMGHCDKEFREARKHHGSRADVAIMASKRCSASVVKIPQEVLEEGEESKEEA
uniref:EF-hand domain-containing protein n=1 Tax=Trieres chinensis TaxID=1514140 RepID=A0A7S2EWM9_TRICV|mmetsp:Transcript_8313/g.17625  ORF Transcript_8313/g.17625 Transcript_8313/m.17625 type:complete len:469 (+) Transcript_8313:187-1593(+)|eukprot:CAMPEP_0183312482 /NCGR_PEP_ID=MMETSP0160_2-20130417/41772_1 /TAXON_ID=2839 ORGANISM="Odontella Sinensis, Strain Grunow 1884" /NCGR_SAMPLE_ID=MMETSP0160_2 /ASSEMBLY_ACC=CAM_ASM_000250 /LENGTH=468 /DNA_ID=CAMNT_0025477339 /DNA_START=65 /DNA_END=1471 /DNA_ORIENTATION=+